MSGTAARYFHVSHSVTYLSLLAGLGAVVSAKETRSWSAAGALIALSALADTLDGRFARLFKQRAEHHNPFGVQLDSLTDALAFGLVPVVSYYLLGSFESLPLRLVWLAAAFFYVTCAITRLGVYNLQRHEHPGFIGLPTTVAGLIWSSLFLFKPSILFSTIMLLACGVAMVSFIPISRSGRLGMALVMGWAILLVVLHGASLATHQ